MLIAIDGACKRNGQPDCLAAGVAWIQTEDGQMLYKSRIETCSTNQRGELFGLLEALHYAADTADKNETIFIVTDSEYLLNSVMQSWYKKWQNNNWIGSTGTVVKNVDIWKRIAKLLDTLNEHEERVFLTWTKGHLMKYTPSNIKRVMKQDDTGIELFMRVTSIAFRACEADRIYADFKHELEKHEKMVPPKEIGLQWVIANTVADCLATFVVSIADEVMI